MGLSSVFALASASSPHGYQSTGLCACCSRYGLVSFARRLVCLGLLAAGSSADNRAAKSSDRTSGARAPLRQICIVVSTCEGLVTLDCTTGARRSREGRSGELAR